MSMPMTDSGILVSADWFPKPEIIATHFDNLGIYISSYREPLERSVRRVVIPSILQNFVSGGRPDAWAELAEVTIKKRDRLGLGHDILTMSGKLKKQAQMLTAWTINRTEATTKSFANFNGGKAWYGDIHQEGQVNSRSDIPARPFMVIQEEDVPAIEFVFYEWLAEKTQEAGFRMARK